MAAQGSETPAQVSHAQMSIKPITNDLVLTGAAVLRMSSNGRCCSIVWPDSRRYAVYAQGASDDWHKVDEESGTSVAWAGASSTYAVLHQPRVTSLAMLSLPCCCGHSWPCPTCSVLSLPRITGIV